MIDPQTQFDDATHHPTAEAVCSERPNAFPDRRLTPNVESSRDPMTDHRILRDLMSAAPADGTGISGCVKEPRPA